MPVMGKAAGLRLMYHYSYMFAGPGYGAAMKPGVEVSEIILEIRSSMP